MRSLLYLRLDGFYTRCLPVAPSKALVVHSGGAVLDSDRAARERKVLPGIALSEAKAVLREDGRYVEMCEPEFIERRDEWLDLVCAASGSVEPGMPHEAWADLSAHPDPVAVAGEVVASLVRQGWPRVEAGLAPARWIARLSALPCDPRAAGLGVPCLEAVVDPAEFLAPWATMKIEPLEAKVRLRLTDLGYRRIGQVARAPLRSLVSQFGREAHRIQECALGRFPDPVRPLYPPDAVAAEVRFDQPVADSLALGEAVARLASELAGSLSQRHQVGSDLWLCVRLESGATTVRKRRLAKPAHRATTLRVALAAELDRARPSEPVESLKALMPRLSANPGGQTRLFVSSGSAEPERAAEAAFRTVRAAFGDSAIEVASRLAPPRRERVLREWRRATGWR